MPLLLSLLVWRDSCFQVFNGNWARMWHILGKCSTNGLHPQPIHVYHTHVQARARTSTHTHKHTCSSDVQTIHEFIMVTRLVSDFGSSYSSLTSIRFKDMLSHMGLHGLLNLPHWLIIWWRLPLKGSIHLDHFKQNVAYQIFYEC